MIFMYFAVAVITAGVADAENFDYNAYDEVLSDYVDDEGMVDYSGLKGNHVKLDEFLARIKTLEKEAYASFTNDEKLAFWINAYNACTLDIIIRHYPIEASFGLNFIYPENSIRQIDGVWDRFKWEIMGEFYTLNNIEHDVIRPRFNEPRIHIALVCAAMGCPPLLNEPYRGDVLYSQFAGRLRLFLQNPEKFRIDREDETVYVSPIFKWYGEDFIPEFGDTEKFGNRGEKQMASLHYISTGLPPDDSLYLESGDYQITYLKYDWSLNTQ
jgi:hypothetical protein